MKPKPLMTESAPRPWGLNVRAAGERDFPRHILLSAEFAASGGDLFALYEEMEEKDGHLFSVLQTRKNGVLARERSILPSGETAAERAVAQTVREIIDAIPNFTQTLQNILDALGKGFSVQEILWEPRADGRIGIAAIKSRYPGRFAFDAQGALCLEESGRAAHGLLPSLRALPERKFLVCVFGGQYSNPYGKGLLARAFWFYWFKKNNLRFWSIYNERFGAPTAVARCGAGVPEEERRRMLEVLESLQTDTGVVIPENVTLEFLESRGTAGGATYREFADWCNDEMSKIVLGQTLTASEGRRSGSLALGRVHDEVRNDYIESDAQDLMAVINSQLIPWIVGFNFPPQTPCPRWVIDTAADDDLQREMQIDQALLGLGVGLSPEYFYSRYRRPAPRQGERALRYDDQNLFQYHMRFGVLTVNEVRERLGLPPVPWGHERVQAPMPEMPSVGAGSEALADAPETSQEAHAQPHESDARER